VKFGPKKTKVLGRLVDVVESDGGLVLPDSKNNATIFVIVDETGPDVTVCKVGDIVLPHHFNHIYIRGGMHRVVFDESDILTDVTEVRMDQLSIEGVKQSARGNGQPNVAGAPV